MERYNIAKKETDEKLLALEAEIRNVRIKSQKIIEQHTKVVEEQHTLTQQNGGVDIQPSDKLHLNVGGVEMYALRETLTLVKGSRLELLFSGRFENKFLRDEKGCIFFDLDVFYFKKIMEYLYSLKTDGSDDNEELQQDWPTFSDRDEQKTFDLYVDFFGLKKKNEVAASNGHNDDNNDDKSDKTDIIENKKEKDDNSKPYKGLLDAFQKEMDELDLVEKNLNEMMKGVGEEDEDFISFFTTTTAAATTTTTATPATMVTTTTPAQVTQVSSEDCSCLAVPIAQPVNDDTPKSQILNLWIDGEIVSVKRSTLCACEGSCLEENFNDDEWIKKHSFKNNDGLEVVLMEHASVFKSIINQLRLRSMNVATKQVDGEYSYDELPNIRAENMGLVEKVVSTLFAGKEEFVLGEKGKFDSLILTSRSECDQLTSWLEEVDRTKAPTLLYRASCDGWETESFHSKCSNKNNTIVIAKTSEGYIMGGYSDQKWEADKKDYKRSNSCFLFSFVCHAGLQPVKMMMKSGKTKYATYTDYEYGPAFGNGCDIAIGVNSSMKNGYANPNHSYEMPSGATKIFLSGKAGYSQEYFFEVTEVEVFEV